MADAEAKLGKMRNRLRFERRYLRSRLFAEVLPHALPWGASSNSTIRQNNLGIVRESRSLSSWKSVPVRFPADATLPTLHGLILDDVMVTYLLSPSSYVSMAVLSSPTDCINAARSCLPRNDESK
ncbi:expressed unknown protein [Seminavis robusta]|uniref:Uncharacterized protein n=1 Tax=Seminavis robusta TaxID=568900 RepID=A0A9N8DGG4_9STRA|nr:expressed unknown protein [Seminavis robusta]|eukprot:Sro76_g041461.1  (125) ;mRNA; r:3268-3642